MEEERVNKTKTFLVVMIFILIIIISAYVVYKKAIVQTIDNKISEVREQILDKSTNKIELSTSNKTVKKLYEIVNGKDVDYVLYLYRNKSFDWDLRSFMTVKSIDDEKVSNDLIDASTFKEKYKSIFGIEIENNLTSEECGSASYVEDTNSYKVNNYCFVNKKDIYLETYLKDIIFEDGFVKVNKYYVFIEKTPEGYNLYSDDLAKEEYLIALDVSMDEISTYINKMNTITYNFKSAKNNTYYLDYVN